jgi:predicted Rossmann-fold nucleotide-binding protein
VANTVLDAGGEAIGVIPKALVERAIVHTRLTDLRVVGSMQERKALMSTLSERFVALPRAPGRWRNPSRS